MFYGMVGGQSIGASTVGLPEAELPKKKKGGSRTHPLVGELRDIWDELRHEWDILTDDWTTVTEEQIEEWGVVATTTLENAGEGINDSGVVEAISDYIREITQQVELGILDVEEAGRKLREAADKALDKQLMKEFDEDFDPLLEGTDRSLQLAKATGGELTRLEANQVYASIIRTLKEATMSYTGEQLEELNELISDYQHDYDVALAKISHKEDAAAARAAKAAAAAAKRASAQARRGGTAARSSISASPAGFREENITFIMNNNYYGVVDDRAVSLFEPAFNQLLDKAAKTGRI